jgi:signal peptidase I
MIHLSAFKNRIMPVKHIFVVYLISTLIVFLPAFGFAKLFKKAGVDPKKAYIPFYNTWIMQGLAQRPKHWVFWQFIPVIGWFISPGIFIEFAKVFGKFGLGQHTLASLAAPFYFPVMADKPDTKFVGPEAVKKHKKSGVREWVDAAIFAIVAATLIRTFIFEAYTIPTGSMEKSLLVNDFLFVSKFSYGPRIPNTPLSIPFIHNYLPGSARKSYSQLLTIPYVRWFESPVKRGDAVVFNFPEGDTVINKDEYQSAQPYYDFKRRAARGDQQSIKMTGMNTLLLFTRLTKEIIISNAVWPLPAIRLRLKMDNCLSIIIRWIIPPHRPRTIFYRSTRILQKMY